ncbi:geranylgeranyl reductase family protein [Granulicella sp. L46]|uniref:geranylgeranyl reductase family protein n=1 Tax=Granulicella sp. L46 TaxID=1641865 RepID=UPI00131E3922|nr:geranylgeranyl reductase family protein [Granulicella sp. L46]
MIREVDILIAGAGPAGCAAAYDLAQAGKHVILLDKRSFPRHKPCACGLTRKTLKALRYSIDPVIERVCHEIVLQSASNPGAPRPASGTWDSTSPPAADKSADVRVKTRNPICAMAVRERFDNFCLQQTLLAARQGGSVELRKVERIVALHESPDFVELDVATPRGPETLRAPILLGADGSNGQTRRLHRQDCHGEAPSPSAQEDGFALEATVPYTSLPATLPNGAAPHDLVFDFAPLPGGYGWLFPKADHINIGVGAFAPATGASHAQLKQVTRALLLDYAQQKLGVTDLAHITGQQLGMGGHTYIPRGRILLVGDAAGLVDPLTGEGIHSAIVSGQAAAAAILECDLNDHPNDVAAAYAHHLAPLLKTLTFSHRAARAFYAQPERGFKAMRLPFMRGLILKTYADGLPHTSLITALAKLV